MNYGKKATMQLLRKYDNKSSKVKNKVKLIVLKILLVVVIVAGAAGISSGIGVMKGIIDSAPDISKIDVTPTGYSTTVLAANGEETATLVGQGANRQYVTIDEIPLDLQHAFVAIEDERFYDHNGIDLHGIGRAFISGLSKGRFSEGASTITQQLIKNNVLTSWTSETSFVEKLQRKIQEQYLALELEKQVKDKDWILENYMNSVNLGANTLGVQAASKKYFNKDVSELTLSEASVIAGITQNPSGYNPITHPDKNAKRREKVLNNMKDQGYISKAQYDEAMADDVYSRIAEYNTAGSGSVNTYFIDALIDNVFDDLTAAGYSETEAYKLIYKGGLTIKSTQDLTMQTICDDSIVEGSEAVNITLEPQVAMTVIDQSTGEVKALVGGRGDKSGNRTWNRATDTCRQPGSTFKIIGCYAAALDAGGKTLASVQDDAPFTVGSKTFNNYDKSFGGFTSIRWAITKSINIVTVKTLQDIGVELGYKYAEDFGISTLTDSDKNLSLALGGLTKGVTNLELTGAYATIANGGVYLEPKFYTQVLDHDGNVLLDKTNTQNTRTVIKDTTAWLLTDAMKDVLTQGTGKLARFDSQIAQAGKSGTTTSNRDCLWAGYTPYYTCVVWGGYDDNSKQSDKLTSYPKNIWRNAMSRIHEGLETKDFVQPDGITNTTVCSKSGLVPLEGICDNDPRGSMLTTEYFDTDTVPTDSCDHHVALEICADSGAIAGPYCPNKTSKVFITGAVSGSPEYEFMADDTFMNTVCTLHDATSLINSSPTTTDPTNSGTTPGSTDGTAAGAQTGGAETGTGASSGAGTGSSGTGTGGSGSSGSGAGASGTGGSGSGGTDTGSSGSAGNTHR